MKQATQQWMKNLLTIAIFSLAASAAMAETIEVSATFRHSAGSNNTKFINTTPVSGICQTHPGSCEVHTFSVATGISTGSKILPALSTSANPRDHAFFKLIDAKTVAVTREGSGETHDIVFTPNLFSARYHSTTMPGGNWQGGNFVNSTGGRCSYNGLGWINERNYTFAWELNASAAPCVKYTEIARTFTQYTNISFGYVLTTPNPLKMATGIYKGQVRYTVGAHADLDFGDDITFNTDELIFNFTLTVVHDLKVQLGANGNTATLVPTGGWTRWIGQAPPALKADLPFQLSNSIPLKVYLANCEFSVGNRCGISNGSVAVPIDVAITLPLVRQQANSQAVKRLALGLDKASAAVLQAITYVDQQPSLLHFSTDAETTKTMTAHAGSTFNGKVTIMFDTNLD